MGIFRQLLRSITNALGLFAGLWGLAVTDDFVWLFAAVALAGLLNLVIGIHDEIQLRTARSDAQEDRKALREIREIIGAKNLPIHLRDLTKIPTAELKALVEAASRNARALESHYHERTYNRNLRQWPSAISRDAMEILWSKNREEDNADRAAMESDYKANYRPGLVALWNEVTRRGGLEPARWDVMAITIGGLAGPRPIETAVTELEKRARELADD